ncbi:MAG: hypothetical protein QW279_05255 [Candidatus Jordarchaeaceae archaeon]
MPIIAGILYMTNFWSLVSLWTVPYTFNFHNTFAFAFFPLMVAFFIKGLKETKWVRFICFSSMVSLLIAPAYINPTLALVQVAFILFVTLLYLIQAKQNILKLLARFPVFVGFYFLFNAYWILPLIPLYQTFLSSPYRVYSPDVDAFRDHSVSLIDALRFSGSSGYWTLKTTVCNDQIIPWASVYSSQFFVLLSFGLPLLAFLAIILKPRDKGVFLFSIIAVISVLFITGSNPPFGNLLEKILYQSNLIALFRDPFNKFGYFLSLSYSYLWAVSLSTLVKNE